MERDEKIIEMYESGLGANLIAKELCIGKKTVYRVLHKYGIPLQITKHNNCLICGKEIKKGRRRCDTCNTKIRRYRAKKAAVEYLGGKCIKCGWSGNLAVFDFHHREQKNKDFNPSANQLANRPWDEVKKELGKCDLLCSNCHRLEHNDYNNEDFLNIANLENEDLIFKK